MGSSGKKHKKESRRKRHRSRSRTRSRSPRAPAPAAPPSPPAPPAPAPARRHKKHKKHRERERDRSPDVEEVPVDSHLVARNGDASKEYSRDRQIREEAARERVGREEPHERRDESRERREEQQERQEEVRERREEPRERREEPRERREETRERREEPRERREEPRERASKEDSARDRSPPATSNSESLSIEETNRLRAKLGLKPLQLQEETAEDGKITDDLGEFYHKPAANLSDKRRTDKIKEKLKERKERRQLEQRFMTSSLAEGSEDEDAVAWVKKTREITRQKEEAAKRAVMLDEMDAVFGVGALVAEEEREERGQRYTSSQLAGLRVAHDTDNLAEGRELVLTLADKNLLDEDDEDVLVNVNLVDDEKYKKNIEERKKAKVGYQAYDDAEEMEMEALGYSRPVLAKYDEEIDKEASAKQRGFVIGDDDAHDAKRFRQMMIKARLAGQTDGRRLESLQLPELRVASDYLSEAELNTKFKKPKRKGKMRRKAKAEVIDVDEYDPSTAPLDTDDTEVNPAELQLEAEPEEPELEDSELQVALARARRLRQLEQLRPRVPKVEELLEAVKEETGGDEAAAAGESGAGTHMILDATAEFCRTLGDIPTYGLAGNRETHTEIMDFDREEGAGGAGASVEEGAEGEATGGAWSRVDVDQEKPPDITAGGSGGALEAEPALGAGVGGALRLALSKGYLERQNEGAATRASNIHHLLTARHYSIDDKAHGDDDKLSRRGQDRYSGPLQDFREKSNFKPNVKLEYVDDEGHPLCPKEAFRYLSHKFHGKGPGKNKQEKRIKKGVQEGLMKKMSSTDTPLGTLAMLQGKQKETQSPYVLLSGVKREPQ